MLYLDFLQALHTTLRPETYLEIGIRSGSSLALSSCRSVAIDPAFSITCEIDADIAVFRTTSDEYFARPNPLAPTGGRTFDLAFIDGLHLFEFALRDFVHAERNSNPGTVVVFDDVLPHSVDEAARDRHTRAWTGDVFKIVPVLARYRPDLTLLVVDTRPRGLLIVLGADARDTTLTDRYDEIVASTVRPDPQVVPPEVFHRELALNPRRVLDAPFWKLLAPARTDPTATDFRATMRQEVATALGPAFG